MGLLDIHLCESCEVHSWMCCRVGVAAQQPEVDAEVGSNAHAPPPVQSMGLGTTFVTLGAAATATTEKGPAPAPRAFAVLKGTIVQTEQFLTFDHTLESTLLLVFMWDANKRIRLLQYTPPICPDAASCHNYGDEDLAPSIAFRPREIGTPPQGGAEAAAIGSRGGSRSLAGPPSSNTPSSSPRRHRAESHRADSHRADSARRDPWPTWPPALDFPGQLAETVLPEAVRATLLNLMQGTLNGKMYQLQATVDQQLYSVRTLPVEDVRHQPVLGILAMGPCSVDYSDEVLDRYVVNREELQQHGGVSNPPSHSNLSHTTQTQ